MEKYDFNPRPLYKNGSYFDIFDRNEGVNWQLKADLYKYEKRKLYKRNIIHARYNMSKLDYFFILPV